MKNENKAFESMVELSTNMSKECSDCCVEISKIAMKHAEEIGKAITTMNAEATEKGSGAFKTLTSSKTLNEMAENNTKLIQQQMDWAFSSWSKIAEMSIKAGNDCSEPLQKHMTNLFSKEKAA